MKIAIPYMGPVAAYKKLIESFGHEVIEPQKPTQRTIDLGAKYSPEFLCFPFKCMLGTYLEAIERGADTVVTSGGDGSCRAGFYAEVHQQIIHSMGHNVRFFIFDSLSKHPKEFCAQLSELKGKHSWLYMVKRFWLAYQMIAAMDRVEAKVRILRAHERNKGDVAKSWSKIKQLFEQCDGWMDVRRAEKQAYKLLKEIPLQPWNPDETIRIGLVGEIYVTMEGHANLEIEETLGALGVEVVNSQYVSHWLQHRIKFFPWQKSYLEQILDNATPYLKLDLGGHEKDNIAYMIDFRERGINGVIHLMPFACLPELITQSIIPTISQDLDMPILSLACDEQRGNANNQTRLEAFVDLIRNKKMQKMTVQHEIPIGGEIIG